jgi:alpha-glucoside transport system permease protein
MSRDKFASIVNSIPLHLVIIVVCLIWILPTLGILVTSFRPQEAVNDSGWWTVVDLGQIGQEPYNENCAACHGENFQGVEGVDLSNPDVIDEYGNSLALWATFDNEYDGEVHIPEDERLTIEEGTQDAEDLADIIHYLRVESGLREERETFTLNNYVDVLVGYTRQGSTYREACESDDPPASLECAFLEDATQESDAIFRGFINSMLVAVPATFLPIILAAFASFALSWLDFNGRRVLFATLVGLQIVPLQMVLVPIFQMYNDLNLNGTFFGVWLFHTGFGMPYAIYLIRNFIGGLPADLFETAYLDGASHLTVFRRIVLPLALPAIAALGIYQFLWVWNDLLVALIFLGNDVPVLTYLLNQLTTSRGGNWHLQTAAAFISIIVPLIVFFAFQRYFVRGLLAGAVKG